MALAYPLDRGPGSSPFQWIAGDTGYIPGPNFIVMQISRSQWASVAEEEY